MCMYWHPTKTRYTASKRDAWCNRNQQQSPAKRPTVCHACMDIGTVQYWHITHSISFLRNQFVKQKPLLTRCARWVVARCWLFQPSKPVRGLKSTPPKNRPQPTQSTLVPNKKHDHQVCDRIFLQTARKSAQCCLRCLGFQAFPAQAACVEKVLKPSSLQLCQWHWNRLWYLFYFTCQKIIIACFLGRDMYLINILLILVMIMGPYCKSRSIGCLGIPMSYFTMPRAKG